MKTKISIFALSFVTAFLVLSSCSWNIGIGDTRNRNIEKATLAHLDSISKIEYVGLADTHELNDGNFQAVVIYNIPDSVGNMVERNARVITNHDGSKIYSWENLDSHVMGDIKKKVSEKFEEKGIDMDGSLIDDLIKLKRR